METKKTAGPMARKMAAKWLLEHDRYLHKAQCEGDVESLALLLEEYAFGPVSKAEPKGVWITGSVSKDNPDSVHVHSVHARAELATAYARRSTLHGSNLVFKAYEVDTTKAVWVQKRKPNLGERFYLDELKEVV